MRTLAIVGPTASGKSQLALTVAQARNAADKPTEVVAVDAFTVYRRMDVGTAKPSRADREAVAHHMLDVLEPSDEVNVAAFQSQARATIAAVHTRGATALLTGGSGLYFRAVVDDLEFPPTDADVRARIDERFAADPDGAHELLAQLDPAAAASIGAHNLRRLVRALEVIELTGTPFSAFSTAWEQYQSIYDDLTVGYLEPDAEVLRARIRARADQMVADGLVDEARALRASGLSRTAAQGIGYAEAFAVLDGNLDVGELAEAIAVRTWRYAKRQRAWFRADPRCTVVDPPELVEHLVAA